MPLKPQKTYSMQHWTVDGALHKPKGIIVTYYPQLFIRLIIFYLFVSSCNYSIFSVDWYVTIWNEYPFSFLYVSPICSHWYATTLYTSGIKLSIFWNFDTNFLTHYIKQISFVFPEQKSVWILTLPALIHKIPKWYICIMQHLSKNQRLLHNWILMFMRTVSATAVYSK